MDVNNRELALQTGLLLLLVSTVVIGAGGFILSFFLGVHQSHILALRPDSALVILLCGLGLSAVMAGFEGSRKAASIALAGVASYTLIHNGLDPLSHTDSLLSGYPRLPSHTVPILFMATFCLWIGPQGHWQRRIWQLGGLFLWIISCITLAVHYGWSAPSWLPRASALIPGLIGFLFGIAMMMVSLHVPRLKTSLSRAAVLAGILGVILSMSSWFLVSWDQHMDRHQNEQPTRAPLTGLALIESADSAKEPANLLAAVIALFGLLLTYQLVFNLALISARAQRSRELSQTKETLQHSEQQFRSLFTQNPDAVFSLNLKGYHVSVNRSVLTLLETNEAQIVGRHWKDVIAPEHHAVVNAAFKQALVGIAQRFDMEVISQKGNARQLDVSFLPTVVQDKVVGVYGIAKDMTALRQHESQLRIYQRSLEASSNGIVICEAQQKDYPIVYVNPAFTEITGYTLEEVTGRCLRFLQGKDTDPQQIAEIQCALEQQYDISLTLRHYRKNGQIFWNNLFLSPVRSPDGQVTHFVGSINDISERRDHENELAFHATHDVLTGLGNRAMFEDYLRHDVELARRHQQLLAVLFIDLDEFKPINDTLGHGIGDQVLIHVARRLEEAIRPSDTLCRFGGDEFVLLLPDLESPQQAEDIAQRLLTALGQPYRIERHELYLSASIGIALNEQLLTQPEELLQQADMAMYKAKQQGRNTLQTFTQDINQKLTQRVTLRNDLQEALINEQFELHYQPLLTIEGDIQGFEALVRWNHPVKGAISPALFIPIAEETGQIIALGQWVIERAAKDFLTLQPKLPSHCRISVNLSPMQFHRPSFLSSLKATLKSTGLNANSLELELTEGILMNDADAAINTLHALREMGISVAIDDFGTGFSSLSYLRHLPIDKVKIDRSFINNIAHNSKDAAIVQGIVALAHHLELKVVAEGVETPQQHQQLVALKCDVFQGYLFARPMPFKPLCDWLREQRGHVTSAVQQ